MLGQTADPVSAPDAYQDLLVGLVGDDDPAEVQAPTPSPLRALLTDAGADLRIRPEAGEWSVAECLAHIVDAEIVSSGRYRWILAHEEPEILPYDQDLWVDKLHQPVEDVESLLAVFEPLRSANLKLWARTPVTDRARFGIHLERGPESYELTFVLIAGHDRFHLAQARAALDQIRGRG